MTTPMPTAAQARPPGPSTRVSVAVLVVGLLAGAFGLYAAIAPLLRAFVSTPSIATPGEARLHLSTGRYLVYERTGSSGFGVDEGGDTTLTPGDVTITSDEGGRIFVDDYVGTREVLTRDGAVYTGALAFAIPESGAYTVAIGRSTGRVIVARPLTDTLRSTLKWWAVAGLGGLAAITGTVMWIVGASRRRRVRMAYASYGAAPAGWYPDPQQPGRMRYWNGTIWTEHTN